MPPTLNCADRPRASAQPRLPFEKFWRCLELTWLYEPYFLSVRRYVFDSDSHQSETSKCRALTLFATGSAHVRAGLEVQACSLSQQVLLLRDHTSTGQVWAAAGLGLPQGC